MEGCSNLPPLGHVLLCLTLLKLVDVFTPTASEQTDFVNLRNIIKKCMQNVLLHTILHLGLD